MAEAIKIKIVDMNGKSAGEIEVDPQVFGAKVDRSLVYETVRWQRALKRAGTHHAQTRGEMKGGGAKPWKQKGTGRARAGSRNSPVWVGGAKAHGPQPRNYGFRLPKRSRRQALCSVLTDKLQNEGLIVVDKLECSEGKTKEFAQILKNVGADQGRSVVVTPEKEPMVWRAGKNIAKLTTLPVAGANVYDLVNAKHVVLTKDSVAALQDRVLQNGEEKTA